MRTIELAIVIPAYKGEFLEDTLESLSRQTDLRFNVYIANDGGDETIDSIIGNYDSKLSITYRYFKNNLGHKSLVSAWNRAMALVQRENWIWILPDDDYISDCCVEVFYKSLDNNCDLYRFRSIVVNSDKTIRFANPLIEGFEPAFAAYYDKIRLLRTSSLAEYIFRKDKLNEVGGFKDYPFAWGSDDLAWYRIGKDRGIYSIPEGEVYLRQSELNISSNQNRDIIFIKIKTQFQIFSNLITDVDFTKDISKYSSRENFIKDLKFYLYQTIRYNKLGLTAPEALVIAKFANKIFGGGYLKNLYSLLWNSYRISKKN